MKMTGIIMYIKPTRWILLAAIGLVGCGGSPVIPPPVPPPPTLHSSASMTQVVTGS